MIAARLRRFGPWLALPPALYGLTQGAYLLACTEHLPSEWHDELRAISHPLKWSTVVAMPLLVLRLAETMRARPRLYWQAPMLWAVTGVALVAGLTPYAAAIAEASAKPDASRLWPGTEALASTGADAKFDAAFTVNRIVASEILAMIAIAIVVGLVFRAVRDVPIVAAALVPVSVVVSLIVYSLLVPGGFIMDYDPFIGDVVLGGVLSDLIIPVGPFDPVGAMGIGIAGLTIGAMTVPRDRAGGNADVQADGSRHQMVR